ncbi:MAG: hypothetical protein MUO72_09925 [Bacteroidales bacterium]|nr:hypothetical protein [Bacteroidales bacterium]
MKKLNFLFASLFMVASLVSCKKDNMEQGVLMSGQNDFSTFAAAIINNESSPISDGLITPVIISGANRGGNRTCAEVAEAFNTSFDLCGDKLSYGDFDLDGDYEFSGAFPVGLDVTITDGKFVSFTMSNTGATCYKIGAVIVHGGNKANIYFYANGTLSDGGLAAPLNSSNTPAGLSNLTFCFVECENNLVIAVKSWYWESGAYPGGLTKYGDSEGTSAFPQSSSWCFKLGYNNYPGSAFNIVSGGTIVANVTYSGGQIIVTAVGGRTLDKTYIYIGTLEGLQNDNLSSGGCPVYTNWTMNDADGVIQTFLAP